jgi:hypothetical protein
VPAHPTPKKKTTEEHFFMAQLLQLNTGTLQNSQLSALQKVDPSIVAILTSSPHVAVYIFPEGGSSWERKNIEGPLYLVRRSSLPQFSFVILNRKGNQHMVEMISTHFEFQNQDPYIIFRNTKAHNPVPHGMWFKSPIDRERVWQQFQTIKETLVRRSQQQQQPPRSSVQQLQQQVQQMNVGGSIADLTADQVELSKSQLQKILIGMMKSEKFVDMLHKQYVAALRKRRAAQQGNK